MIQNIGSSLFFTLSIARVDRSGKRMTFAGAGHPPAMIAKPGEEPRLLESHSTVLGVLPVAVDAEPVLEIQLEAGDRFILYTDGITDAFNSQGRMLGVAGFRRFIRETAILPLSEMKNAILERVGEEWREG